MVEFWLATLPVLNAVELVISLNVEPGGNVSLIARFSSGAPGALTSRLSTLLNLTPSWVASSFGSKLGNEARARIAPVRGSMATAAAGLPIASRAVYAASCALGLIVR